MGGPDGTVQKSVGFVSGSGLAPNIIFVDSDGFMLFGNAGIYTGTTLSMCMNKSVIAATAKITLYAAAVTSTFSVVNIPAASYKYVALSMHSNCSQASLWLPSVPEIGRDLYLWIVKGTEAAESVWVSTSGCLIMNQWGSLISGFHLNNSSNSSARVHLKATSATTWSVIESNASYVE